MMTVKELVFGSDELTPKQENLRQLIMYPFAGVFTALANFISFVIMDLIITESIDISFFGHAYDSSLLIKQLVSWVVTIVTAHYTNRLFVFRSHGNYFLELLGFAAARLLSFFLIEVSLFSFMVYWVESHMGLEQRTVLFSIFGFKCTCLYVIKIVSNCVLILMNYIMSKWVVFKARNKRGKSEEIIEDD